MVELAPSILSADFARLGEQVREVESAGADCLHVDVMDGHFVPNLTIGPLVVRSLRPVTRLPLYVHLMVEEPGLFLAPFAQAGADCLIVQVEAARHLDQIVTCIHELGCKAGVALNPATPLCTLEEILPALDLVLIMSVNPGFGGQDLIPGSLGKIARLRRILRERGLERVDVSVDGGVNLQTARDVVEAGANVLVMGSAVFAAGEPPAVVLRRVREIVSESVAQ